MRNAEAKGSCFNTPVDLPIVLLLTLFHCYKGKDIENAERKAMHTREHSITLGLRKQ